MGVIYDCLMTSFRFHVAKRTVMNEEMGLIEEDDLTNDDITDRALMIEDERELSTLNG